MENKTIFHLHTKSRTLTTTDWAKVQACIVSGVVPFQVAHKDGYLRNVYRALTYIETTKVVNGKETEPAFFYSATATR